MKNVNAVGIFANVLPLMVFIKDCRKEVIEKKGPS
jgi:hypothetical protein